MSFLVKVVDRITEHYLELARGRYPYHVREGKQWQVRDGGLGCRPIETQATISMDKDPPPLPEDRNKPKPQLPAQPAAAETGKDNAKSPPAQSAPPPAAAAPAAAQERLRDEACVTPPPFDMLDLPEGMEAMGFKYAAYCARRWFNGKVYALDDPTATHAPDFVDTDTFKLKWILGFGRVRQRHAHLLATNLKASTPENIFNDRAREELLKQFQYFIDQQRNNYYYATLDTLAYCNNDKQAFHRQFQFQRVNVTTFDALDDYASLVNDLTASLANFSFYAAVALAQVSTEQYNWYGPIWYRCTRTRVEVTHIYVYARDSYAFNDDKTVSQYLGHWNRHGVIIARDAAASELISKYSDILAHESGNEPKSYLPPLPAHLDKPVDIGRHLRKKEVFYPVRNRDFRHWRKLKGRGGDFAIFSSFERIKLPTPIVLDLGERRQQIKP
ncbi:DUF6402 family protein [Thauera sinica]|uniref:DUF6402 family protein n=1 Tax=Thauera sinica TaxID=2665146 RepID=A0ABW1APP0_9RHOO|nr:DUF6402 family protein [Thauera sp. K11]ATE59479.1 hypothetical protein CCZ27_05510 [Thauera sp. K11]